LWPESIGKNLKNPYKTILLLFSTLVVAGGLVASALASSDEPVRKPRFSVAEKTIAYVDRTAGFSVELPVDFRLTSEQGDLLFFQSQDRPGTLIVRPRPGLTLSSVQGVLRNGFDHEVVQITPRGSPATLNLGTAQGLAMEAQGNLRGRETLGMLAGIFGPQGQGYMILVGSVRERWPRFKQTAQKMVDSFRVIETQAGFEHERWQQRLSGSRLAFFDATGSFAWGAAHAREYHFCSQGNFFARSDSAQTANNGWTQSTSGTGRKGKGSWKVRFDESGIYYVELLNKGGVQETLELRESAGKILLNDLPFQFAKNELCP
jgi:hypothetical protein